jgi:hypothetical protein
MNQESGRNPINDGRKNEKKRGNHPTESIRPVRYAKGICCSRVSVKCAVVYKHIGAAPRTARRLQGTYLAAGCVLLSRALRRLAAFL